MVMVCASPTGGLELWCSREGGGWIIEHEGGIVFASQSFYKQGPFHGDRVLLEEIEELDWHTY